MPAVYSVLPNALIQVSIRARLFNQRVLSIFTYRYTGASALTDGEQAMDELLVQFQASGKPYLAYLDACSQDLTVETLRAQVIFPVRYVPYNITPTADTGLVASASSPPATAVALTRQASVADRHGRGTLHMPAMPAAWNNGGIVSATGQALYQVMANRLDDVLTVAPGVTYTPVIYNRSAPNTSYTVAQGTPQTTIRTQRTRVVGKGE